MFQTSTHKKTACESWLSKAFKESIYQCICGGGVSDNAKGPQPGTPHGPNPTPLLLLIPLLIVYCLPLMNPTGVSCFTHMFMLNIISVVHGLPVKALEDETADLVK